MIQKPGFDTEVRRSAAEDPKFAVFFEENVRVNQFGFLSASDKALVAAIDFLLTISTYFVSENNV